MSGLGDTLPVASGAIPDVPVVGVTPPEGVSVGSPDGAGFPDEAGAVDWPPPPDGGLDDPPGDADPTLGLGDTRGACFRAFVFVRCGDGADDEEAGVDGTISGAGGVADAETGTLNAPLELAAAGGAVGSGGPLIHGDVELVVDDVVWALAELPGLMPL